MRGNLAVRGHPACLAAAKPGRPSVSRIRCWAGAPRFAALPSQAARFLPPFVWLQSRHSPHHTRHVPPEQVLRLSKVPTSHLPSPDRLLQRTHSRQSILKSPPKAQQATPEEPAPLARGDIALTIGSAQRVSGLKQDARGDERIDQDLRKCRIKKLRQSLGRFCNRPLVLKSIRSIQQ